MQPPAKRLRAMLWRVKQHCLFGHVYHLQKNNAHLITRSFLMIQLVNFTSAAFQDFPKAYLCFLVSASPKKIAEEIKFLGILQKCVSMNKI